MAHHNPSHNLLHRTKRSPPSNILGRNRNSTSTARRLLRYPLNRVRKGLRRILHLASNPPATWGVTPFRLNPSSLIRTHRLLTFQCRRAFLPTPVQKPLLPLTALSLRGPSLCFMDSQRPIQARPTLSSRHSTLPLLVLRSRSVRGNHRLDGIHSIMYCKARWVGWRSAQMVPANTPDNSQCNRLIKELGHLLNRISAERRGEYSQGFWLLDTCFVLLVAQAPFHLTPS
jgi:hypothetical protein